MRTTTVTNWIDQMIACAGTCPATTITDLHRAVLETGHALDGPDRDTALDHAGKVVCLSVAATRAGQIASRDAGHILALTCHRLGCQPSDLLTYARRRCPHAGATESPELRP